MKRRTFIKGTFAGSVLIAFGFTLPEYVDLEDFGINEEDIDNIKIFTEHFEIDTTVKLDTAMISCYRTNFSLQSQFDLKISIADWVKRSDHELFSGLLSDIKANSIKFLEGIQE